MLTQQEKIEHIKEKKDAAIVAVTAYLDAIYSIKEKYLDEDENLRPGLSEDEKAVEFIKSVQQDTDQFEIIRRKLLNGDFNLSLIEITRIGLCFMFMKEQMSRQIEELAEGVAQAKLLIEKLIDSSAENIDFSKE